MPSSQISCGSTEGRASAESRDANDSVGAAIRPIPARVRSEYQASPAGKISEAASHLRVALLQAHPHDDKIILEHVREALKLLEAK